MKQVQFRQATLEDAAQLWEIYRYYVEETAITFEWTVPTVAEFRSRMEYTLKRYPYIVAQEGERVVGYAYAGAFVGREAYDWCAEVTIYLYRDCRGYGVGRRLYTVLERILKRMNILKLYACIGYPEKEDCYLTKNSAEFHAHLGYRLVGRFAKCGYKFGRWYDMVWMERMIGDHSACPKEVRRYPALEDDLQDIVWQV